MNNKFVKVHNEPKAILLHAWMQRKQQQSRFEILQISKQSCTVNVIICVNNMRRMQLFVYRQTVPYNASCALKILIFNSEFSDSVLLLGIVIFTVHIPYALLISVTLCSCFRRTEKRMCVIDYIYCSQHGSLLVI
jgi:hypothetical protein